MPDATGLVGSINATRANHGLPSLTENPKLTEAAQGWACAMGVSGTLAHGDFASRLRDALGEVAGGECVAEGQADAASAVDAWLADPPHRVIMLGDFNVVGVGSFAGDGGGGAVYWCADFARVGDA